jgi:hypothetical protein
MASHISYHFTLFKKFQVIDHVPTLTVHGSAAPPGGFNLNNPNAPFVACDAGTPLTLGDFTPANNPLWAGLNSRAQGNAGFSPVSIPGGAQAGSSWPTMPPANTQGWTEFQLNPSTNKIVDVFGQWITNDHQLKDIPAGVIAQQPAPFPPGLEAGIKPFVCSMAGDKGTRPGVPSNYWATSLIFLVDPATGNIVTPANLAATAEYYLVAVIGNRGQTDGGRYLNQPDALQAAASVMVWNTIDSPGVQLPSLSNVDLNDTNGIFEQYFLRAGAYDVVGFRLNVQTVFNGVIAALNNALVSNPNLLGGVAPDLWVKQQPAHLCSKVVVRVQGDNFPTFGTTPDQDARIAQKNLAPFDPTISATDPNPNINWKNFIVGQPLFFLIKGAGKNTLKILIDDALQGTFKLHLAIPAQTYERFVKGADRQMKGFTLVDAKEFAASHGRAALPFPETVILSQQGADNVLEFGPLTEGHFAAMSLGIEYVPAKVKNGLKGDITIVQESMVARLDPGSGCYKVERAVVGGFTLQVRAVDPHIDPKGNRIEFGDN